MKILLISPTQSGIGGTAQHVQGLKKFLEQKNNQVEIISSENTFIIPVKGLKNPSFMISSLLKAKFKKNQDIVHAHNIPSALAMKNTSGKKILSIHGIFSKQIDELHGKTTGSLSEKYEHDALEWADAITVISKEAYDHYSKLGHAVFQVPNGINVSSFPCNEDRRYEKQLIFAGRLSKEKGIDMLIEIAKKLSSDVHLIILGNGPEENKIQNLDKSQENIHYLGYQPKEKTLSLISGSDILIQPSIMEGISSTILESMAANTPVIATNVGGNGELIETEKNGILVEPNDVLNFNKQIDLLINNEELRKSLANQAQKTVEKYDWNQVGNLYLNIYESVLNNSK